MPSRSSAAAFRAESWILPKGLWGNSSKNSTCCGTLKEAALLRTRLRICSSVMGVWAMTQAQTVSP